MYLIRKILIWVYWLFLYVYFSSGRSFSMIDGLYVIHNRSTTGAIRLLYWSSGFFYSINQTKTLKNIFPIQYHSFQGVPSQASMGCTWLIYLNGVLYKYCFFEKEVIVSWEQFFGTSTLIFGSLMSLFGLPAQIRKNKKTKSCVFSLSLLMLVIGVYFSRICYSLIIKAYYIVLPDAIGELMSIVILFQYFKYNKR